LSYSIGSSQAGADLQKGTWLTDVSYEGSRTADGSSNTLMLAEKHISQDDDLLTFDQYTSHAKSTSFVDANGGEDSRGLWQINVEPTHPFGEPVTFTATISIPHGAVGIETLTLAHEGFLFF